MSASAESQAPAATQPRSDDGIVGSIASKLVQESFGTGPLAELRRLDPNGRLSEPTLHRLLARHEIPEGRLRGEGLRDWALVIHCLALAAPDNLLGEAGLGRALHDAGFGEKRLVNLLDASAEELRDRLPRAVRFLVQRGGRVHGARLADLVLIRPASDRYDAVRQRIAHEFYRAEYEASKTEAAD